jgi:pyruvate dehydrogenase E1 component alpha subunit
LARDPIPAYRERLQASGVTDGELDQLEAVVTADLEAATVEAKAGATPSLGLVDKDVWADGGTSWRN